MEGVENRLLETLADLPRVWAGTYLPGYHDWGDRFAFPPTYAGFPLDWLPPIERELDDELRWLLREPPRDEALEGSATRADLDALLSQQPIALPLSFVAFIDSAQPRKRIRSATDCYLRLPDSIVRFGEGRLLTFLADSQACAFWLLYTGADGEAVIVTEYPPGFEFSEEDAASQQREPGSLASDASVCADSFSEFLYRLWIENEIFFRLTGPEAEREPLTDEQRRYGEHFRDRMREGLKQ
jgi:hypothetical protein